MRFSSFPNDFSVTSLYVWPIDIDQLSGIEAQTFLFHDLETRGGEDAAMLSVERDFEAVEVDELIAACWQISRRNGAVFKLSGCCTAATIPGWPETGFLVRVYPHRVIIEVLVLDDLETDDPPPVKVKPASPGFGLRPVE